LIFPNLNMGKFAELKPFQYITLKRGGNVRVKTRPEWGVGG